LDNLRYTKSAFTYTNYLFLSLLFETKPMATVLITGGTGLIGKALTKALVNRGHDVIILTRDKSKEKDSNKIYHAEWNIKKQTIDRDAIHRADFIVHLAGANVAEKPWTKKRKREIVDSRVKSASLLIKALETPNKVKAVISASAIGWYGPDDLTPNSTALGEERRSFIETDPPANDFLGATCRQWESSIQPVVELGKRLVILRTGIVLSNEGGAYAEFKKYLNFGIATILGNGKQVISWIHIADLVRLYIEAIENDKLHGIYNAVAPNPVTNKTLVLEMAKQLNKFHVPIPVPSFALKTVLGEMSIEVLKSTTVSSEKIESTGFQFMFLDIETAVYNLIKKAS